MEPSELVQLVTGLALAALGAWVVYLDPRSRLHRAFGLMMAPFAASTVFLALIGTFDVRVVEPWFLQAMLALPWATLHFALAFHDAHAPARPGSARHALRHAPLALWLASALAFAIRPTLLVAGGPRADALYGLVVALPAPVMAATAWVLATAGRASGQGGAALRPFAIGLALHPAFIAAFLALETLRSTDAFGSPQGYMLAALSASAIPLAAAAAGAAERLRHPGASWLGPGWWPVGAAFATAVLTSFAGPALPGATLLTAFGSAWKLLMASFVAYAILARSLFGLDPRLRTVIREGAFAGAVGLSFFVAEQVAQGWLQERTQLAHWQGVALGLLAAGAVTAALVPLRGALHRLALRLVPRGDTEDASLRKRRNIYRAALLAAQEDGLVTPAEREALRQLARALRLGASDVEVAAADDREAPRRAPRRRVASKAT